ncbi:hypothetical protein PACILC2_05670 [Paenibacillus cisolokensis]|uniref:HTH iclR-type domain-containing protein n=1 Tax=Paenibacillus cisolokensis TaxID=1658519 RepID=A0ABQ4N1F2_9BACL|nr:hypothetical protein PACILC2_05670 [Paenibacillus cisolokensis]
MSDKHPRLIQSVQRALDIINCFDSLHVQLSLTEISEKLNLNISTVYGLINTLSAYSYIDKNPDNGKYKLGLEFLLKANLVSQSLDLKEIGHSYLTDLTKKYHETSHLYVYQHEQIFAWTRSNRPTTTSLSVQERGISCRCTPPLPAKYFWRICPKPSCKIS